MDYLVLLFFFIHDTSTTEIYTLSLHDALPISSADSPGSAGRDGGPRLPASGPGWPGSFARGFPRSPRAARLLEPELRLLRHEDRKSTRLNSSHLGISYAVFCLKKKKEISRRQS